MIGMACQYCNMTVPVQRHQPTGHKLLMQALWNMTVLATPYLVVDVLVEVRQEAHKVPLLHAQKVPPLLLALVEQLLLVLLVLVQLVLDLGVLLLLAAQKPLLDLLVLVELLVQHGAHSVQLQQKEASDL